MFKKILIPLDGTLLSEQALELAENLFATIEEDLEILLLQSTADATFYLGIPWGETPAVPEHRKTRIDKYIGKTAEATRTWAKNVKEITMIAKPEDAIIKIAVEEDVDLIVMFTHGYSTFERLIVGSVTEKIVREAPCPVLATRDGDVPKHMLIALDGTLFSEAILDPAFALARLIKADVTLVLVDVDVDDLDMQKVVELSLTNRELAKTILATHNTKSEHYLDGIYQRYVNKMDGIKIKVDYDIGYGEPSIQLPKLADQHECDLIAMATHGNTGISRFWNGSVTHDVMHQTKLAMLIIHPDSS
ncbi:MAG: nucleotide-binding universal stress UspA family protein [Candidatus Promineifilaceae bacterium]|jgi:nucleotide-binding universal stress UspA family protein